jgi:hypothetical protein
MSDLQTLRLLVGVFVHQALSFLCHTNDSDHQVPLIATPWVLIGCHKDN